jgi:hypothetical protein
MEAVAAAGCEVIVRTDEGTLAVSVAAALFTVLNPDLEKTARYLDPLSPNVGLTKSDGDVAPGIEDQFAPPSSDFCH